MSVGKMAGKVAVVTGGNRGLGRYMVEAMVREGATVIATSRQGSGPSSDNRDFDGNAETDGIATGQVFHEALDVLSEESVLALFERLESRFQRIDVWVNNAGVGVFKPVVDTSVQEFDWVMNTNVRGLFLCSREAYRHMKARGGGRIINIASIAGYTPIPENGVYGASKYAVRGFSQILNEEGKEFGVRVSVVSPGAVWTEIWDGREGFSPADMLQPQDVAESVLDIASRPLHVRIDEVKIVPPKGVL